MDEASKPRRALWKGAISFGLVNIPVSMYPMFGKYSVRFFNLCRADHAPLKNRRWCEQEQKEVPREGIEKGCEISKGTFVTLTPQDLDSIRLKHAKTIDIKQFTDSYAIDPSYFEKAYQLVPEPHGEKAFSLLREVLKLTGKAAIGKFVFRNREYLALMRQHGGGITLSTMHYPEELVDLSALRKPEPALTDEERGLALALVEAMTQPLDLSRFRDEYGEAFRKLVEAKAGGAQLAPPEKLAEIQVLLDALRASVDEKKKAVQGG